MLQANVKLNPNKQAKPQALIIVNDLKQVIPIERAKMNIRLTFSSVE